MVWRRRAVAVAAAALALVSSVLVPSLLVSSVPLVEAAADGAWVLDEVIVVANDEWWAEANLNQQYRFAHSAEPGGFSMTITWIGADSPSRSQGEAVTFDGTFSAPPSRLVPGDEVSVELALSVSGNTLSASHDLVVFASSFIFDVDGSGELIDGTGRPTYEGGLREMGTRSERGTPLSGPETVVQGVVDDDPPLSVTLTGTVPIVSAPEHRRLVIRHWFGRPGSVLGEPIMSTDFVYLWDGLGVGEASGVLPSEATVPVQEVEVVVTPDPDEDGPGVPTWTVALGSGAAVLAAAAAMAHRRRPEDDRDTPHYVLQVSDDALRVAPHLPAVLRVQVWQVLADGSPVPAAASISVSADPGVRVDPSSGSSDLSCSVSVDTAAGALTGQGSIRITASTAYSTHHHTVAVCVTEGYRLEILT